MICKLIWWLISSCRIKINKQIELNDVFSSFHKLNTFFLFGPFLRCALFLFFWLLIDNKISKWCGTAKCFFSSSVEIPNFWPSIKRKFLFNKEMNPISYLTQKKKRTDTIRWYHALRSNETLGTLQTAHCVNKIRSHLPFCLPNNFINVIRAEPTNTDQFSV